MEKKNIIYGYAWISRKTQNIDRQVKNIKKEFPEAVIFQEAYTGTKIYGRKKFEELLEAVDPGDTIVFDSVSRMSRNAREGIKTYFDLYDKGVELVFLKESYINTAVYKDTASQSVQETGNDIADIYIEATNKVIKLLAKKQIEKAFEQAQKEVDDLHERTREGIREARANGKQIGQKPGATLNVKKKEPTKELIRRLSRDFDGIMRDKEILVNLNIGVSRNTYYKYKRELFEELAK